MNKEDLSMFSMILLVFAYVLFMVAGLIRPPEPWTSRLPVLGLACWVLAEIVGKAVPLLR
jgi:hypothetical protein